MLATTWDTYAKVLFIAGRDSAAFDAALRADELNPALHWSRMWRALVDINRGRKQAALDEIAGDTTSRYPGDMGMWGYVQARAGRREAAMAIAKRFEQRAAKDLAAMSAVGMVALGLGEYDKALAHFVAASASEDLSITMGGLASPLLDPLRSKPGFGELLHAMKLDDQPVARLKR